MRHRAPGRTALPPGRPAGRRRAGTTLAAVTAIALALVCAPAIGGCAGDSPVPAGGGAPGDGGAGATTTASTDSDGGAGPNTGAQDPDTGDPDMSGGPDTGGGTDPSAAGSTTTLHESGRSPGPTRVYEDPDLGFSFAYPEGWKLTVSARAVPGPGGAPLKDVGAFDPTGAKVRGVLLDGVAVSVFGLDVVVNEDLLPAFEQEVTGLVADLRGRLSEVQVVEPLRATEAGGAQGFETTHTFAYEGRRLRSRLVFLAAGGYGYQLTAQAVDQSWETSRPGLDLLVESFDPGG